MDSSSLRKLAPSLLSSGTTLLQVLNFHDLAEELRQAGRVSRNSSFKNYISRLETLASEAENSADETFRRNAARRIGSALRVLADLQNRGKTEEAPFTYYVVEPLSNIKRLPDVYPADGKVESTLRILAAKGEFEPASFLFYPFADAEKVELNVSDLNGENGSIIPASAVRLKIVKCWYQGGTAWYSYFADSTARELIPELLLNDEKMLKVDTAERTRRQVMGWRCCRVRARCYNRYGYLCRRVRSATLPARRNDEAACPYRTLWGAYRGLCRRHNRFRFHRAHGWRVDSAVCLAQPWRPRRR